MRGRKHAGSIALAVEVVLLVFASRFGDFGIPGNPIRFVITFCVASIAYLLAIYFTPQESRAMLWIGCVAIHIAVITMPPGDDMWRYLWEGRVQLRGFNPYVFSPGDPALASLRDDAWHRVNHPDFAAIYPPLTELLFRSFAWVSAPPVVLKTIFGAADFLILALLMRLRDPSVEQPGQNPGWKWFAWNPAVACASAGGGHFDSLMVCLMVLAIYGLARAAEAGKPSWRWSAFSAAALGLAIALKTVPVLLLPIWALVLGGRCIVLSLSLMIPAALSLPYGGAGVVTATFSKFANVTRFNDLVWWLVDATVWPNPGQQNGRYEVVLVVVVLALSWKFRADWRRGVLWILGAALLLSPALHPWYVSWVLPIACWRRVYPWCILSLSAMISILLWEAGPFWKAWEPSPWFRLMIILPPLFALGRYQARATP